MTDDGTIRIEVIRDESVNEVIRAERRAPATVLTYGSALEVAFSVDATDGEHQVAVALAAAAPGSDVERTAFLEAWDVPAVASSSTRPPSPRRPMIRGTVERRTRR